MQFLPSKFFRILFFCLLNLHLGACASEDLTSEESILKSDDTAAVAAPIETEPGETVLAEGSAPTEASDFADPSAVQALEAAKEIDAPVDSPAPVIPDEPIPDAQLTTPSTEVTPAPDLMSDSTVDPNSTAMAAPEGKTVVTFAKSKTKISKKFRQELRDLSKKLKANRQLKISISGHCDTRGSASFNKYLALKRAKAVKTFLKKLGVKNAQMQVTSFGKDKLLSMGETEQEHAQNRRVEIDFQ